MRNPVIRATYTHIREPATQVHIMHITPNRTLRKCVTEPRPQHTLKTWNIHEICPDVHTLRALHPTRHQLLLLSASSGLTALPLCWTFPRSTSLPHPHPITDVSQLPKATSFFYPLLPPFQHTFPTQAPTQVSSGSPILPSWGLAPQTSSIAASGLPSSPTKSRLLISIWAFGRINR